MYMHTLRHCKGGHWNIIPGGYLLDLRDTDKSRYLGLSSSIIVLLFGHWVHFLMNICHFAIFMQKWSQEGEKHGFVYAWADYYLQANTIRWHCAWLQVTWWTLCQWKGGKICIWMIIMSFTYFQIKVSTKVQGFNLHSYQCFISYGSGVLCLLFSILHG